LCINIDACDFDPVAKVYHGLLSAPQEIKEYYESLLGVTSYYQHSQGGKGKYIEKKLASSFQTSSLNIELSQLPIWLEYPELHKKKGIFTLQSLPPDEKSIFRTSNWDWLGDNDVNIDVGSIIQEEKAIVLVEIKNRVDSGGVAARREIWTSRKFGIIVEYLNSNKKLFRRKNETFSLIELLELFKIQTFEIYIGVLFDKGDNPATFEIDRINGFYSASKEGYEYLKEQIKQSKTINIITEDSVTLKMTLGLTYSKVKVEIGALYGNDIPLKLFRKKLPVSDLLLLKYDDIWLSQLITIDERAMLLKYRRNYSTIFLDLLKRDHNLRVQFDKLIKTGCEEIELKDILNYLLANYSDAFQDIFLPSGKKKEEYLADVIQVLCAAEA
jgi:hypothetical protein